MDLSQLSLNSPQIATFLACFPDALLDACRPIRFSAGTTIIRRDDTVTHAFFLLSGEMATYNETPEGKTSIFLSMPAPDLLSDMEVLSRQSTYSSNVMAMTDCLALRCSVSALEQALSSSPDFLREIAYFFAKKTYRVSYQRGGAAYRSAVEKVAILLIHECSVSPPGPGETFAVTKTRAAMASMTVMTSKSVNRSIAALRDGGYLSLSHGKVHVDHRQYERLLSDWWSADTHPKQSMWPDGPNK